MQLFRVPAKQHIHWVCCCNDTNAIIIIIKNMALYVEAANVFRCKSDSTLLLFTLYSEPFSSDVLGPSSVCKSMGQGHMRTEVSGVCPVSLTESPLKDRRDFVGLQHHVTKSSGWFPVCLHVRSN